MYMTRQEQWCCSGPSLLHGAVGLQRFPNKLHDDKRAATIWRSVEYSSSNSSSRCPRSQNTTPRHSDTARADSWASRQKPILTDISAAGLQLAPATCSIRRWRHTPHFNCVPVRISSDALATSKVMLSQYFDGNDARVKARV